MDENAVAHQRDVTSAGSEADVPERQQVAAFDFDGTLCRQDTMVPFLVRAHGRPRIAAHGLAALPRALAKARSLDGLRDGMKLAAVGRLFRGMTEEQFIELGACYAESIPALLRDELVTRLRWHQTEGHATVIVSASLATYLRPVGAELGMDGVLGVELTADGHGVLTGDVDGGVNTRGPHKVTRLRAWLDERFGADTPVELWAYGDSSGDRELLAAADHPTWVGSAAEQPLQP